MDRLDLSAAAQPEAIAAAVVANVDEKSVEEFAHGAGHGGVSVRTSVHRGHQIVVRTSYEVLVDGRPFDPHFVVDNAGRVHYHGLPTRDFASIIELVEKAIDVFPDDFAVSDEDDGGGHPPGHGHGTDGGETGAHGTHGGHDAGSTGARD